MLEPFVRSNLSHFQGLYERFPSPARHLLTSARGWFLTRIRYSSKTFALLRALRQDESWNAEQIALFQLCALRQILEHAHRTVPFYSAYPRAEIRDFNDLRRMQILDRETVLQNQERLLSRSTGPHQRIRAGTTGTTGASLSVAYTEQLVSENWAFLLRQRAWAGVEPRHPRITLQGARIVPADRTEPPYWTYNVPERQILMSIFHLSETTAPDYLGFLLRHRDEVLEGFPSVLGILADFALERGMLVPMHSVFTSGEPLYASTRAKIEQAFQARVFDTYGMTEYCGLIQECEFGQPHLVPEYGFLEILDENDEPVASDQEGYFVWTGFLNEAMPLIRYRIGDRGRWQNGGPCSCGRAFPLVVPTITRESDLLRCPDGRLFSPRALNQLLKQSASLRFCQFVHDLTNCVVVRAVLRDGTGDSTGAAREVTEIRTSLQELLGPRMQVIAELAATPIARSGGKIPLIVNQVPQ
jgi:phenylacetate-coenzyme A ligase PaaK-like adenylate-forming protein